MSSRKVEFEVKARVNDVPFLMEGIGITDMTEGRFELHVNANPRYPTGFDPISCPTICPGLIAQYIARASSGGTFRDIVGDSFEMSPYRRGTIWDEQGKEVLDLQITATLEDDGDVLRIHQKMVGTSDLPPLKGYISPIEGYLLPAGVGAATGIIRYQLETIDGKKLDGITVLPYRWTAPTILPSPLVHRIERIDAHWNGSNEANFVYSDSVTHLLASKDSEVNFLTPTVL